MHARIVVSATIAVLGSSIVCTAEPVPIVQWTTALGGNNHHYSLVEPPSGIRWTDARTAAANTSILGAPGHLVTLNSQAEWNFVIATFPRDWTWIGLTDEAQEGTFRWVTGEPLTFTRWIPGEPNNAGDEDYVFYQRSSGLGNDFGWNDFPNAQNVFTSSLPIGYVVEYDVVPEPSSIVMGGTAALGILLLATRRLIPQLVRSAHLGQ